MGTGSVAVTEVARCKRVLATVPVPFLPSIATRRASKATLAITAPRVILFYGP